ncbi:SDR family oxidoreductase [Ectothiorhodospiraceae bacterium WFHF3C12]|nr:SDR family oxidoreductase [Ectothiorhodospiraceae bacterium WFHF3C12]
MNERILIAGYGKIGQGLAEHWIAQGARVWGLRRSAAPLPQPVEPLRGDLTDPGSLPAPPPGIDLVYFLATPGRFDDEAYRLTYVEGLRNLVEWLPETAGARLVFVSSTAVYGQTDGRWVDETSPTEPNGFSGRRMLEAERIAADAGGVSVRFGGIYGPGRTRMIDKVRQQEPCVADPPRYTNRIHESDCIGVLAHVGALSHPRPVYLGVDDAPCTQCELMDYIAGLLGLPRPERVSGDPGGLRGSNKRCGNQRLKDSGYRLIYPGYREGYAAIVASG